MRCILRIQPFMLNHKSNKIFQAQFERKNIHSSDNFNKNNHKYTGNPCADLAYASLFDNAIARDLKLMGLI